MVSSMARGRLRPSLRPSPRPRLIPTSCTDVDSDTMAMDLDTTDTARGLLMLRLIPTFCTEDTTGLDTDTVLDTLDTDTADTSTANRLHQDLSVNHRLDLRQKWIVISLKFPSPVLQFQCYHTKSLFMVSRKQENQSGKNPTNIKITKKSVVLFLVNIGRQTIQRCSINTLK